MNINKALIEGSEILRKNKIKFTQLDSEIIMSKSLKKDRKYLVLNLDKSITNENLNIYKDLIKKRSLGKPIAYLTGVKHFWKSEFEIKEHVLIPRPDTEILIQETLKILKFKNQIQILDIGVGSGCILLSILKEKADFYGTGIDISSKSIELSRLNATNLGVINRVKLIKTNVDNFYLGKYDLIISNPPYIKKNEIKYLERDVKCFEPRQALDGGLDGTHNIRKIVAKTSNLLKKNGKLVLEIAYSQKNKVIEILKIKGFYINKIIKDYAHNDRCIISTKI